MNKFLFVLPTDRIGGAERVSMNLVRYISLLYPKATIYVVFMSRGESGSWNEFKQVTNVKLIYNNFKSEKTSFPYLVYLLIRKFKKVDLIYSTHTHVNALMSALRYLKLINTSALVLRESTIISLRFSGIKKLIFDFVYTFYGSQDLLICQTNLMRQELLKVRSKRIACNIKTIPNPLDIDFIERKAFFIEPKINDKSVFEIIIVGRLVPVKNHALVIQALSILLTKYSLNINLKVIGDGLLKETLKEQVYSLGISSFVEFTGNIENPYKLMNTADLGIVASHSEGFPNVLLEMMAAGTKNLIVTPCTGDLDKLPDVTVTLDHSSEVMAIAILNAVRTKENFSRSYSKYAKKRDISNYWNSIQWSLEKAK